MKKVYRPRSPLLNTVTGIIFGVFLLIMERNNPQRAVQGGILFALVLSFIDYVYVYYWGDK